MSEYQMSKNTWKIPPLLKRYPVPIYPNGVIGPRYGVYPPWTYAPGSLVRHDVLGTTYGNCDCSLSSGYPKTNNCQAGGFPVCTAGGCMCYNPILGNAGCFNERGSTC